MFGIRGNGWLPFVHERFLLLLVTWGRVWEVGVVSSLFLNQYWFLLCYANFISVSDQFGWLFLQPSGHAQKKLKSIEWPWIGFDYLKNHNLEQLKSYGKVTRKTKLMIANASIYFVQLLYFSIEKPFCGFQLWKLNDYLQLGFLSMHPLIVIPPPPTVAQTNFKHKSQYNMYVFRPLKTQPD